MWMVLLAPEVYGFFLPSFLEFGSCFEYPQKSDFDMNKFSGTWYTVKAVPNEYIPIVACSNANYSIVGEYIPIVACSNANYSLVDDHVECRERGLNVDGEKKSRVTKLDLLPQGSPTTFMAQGEGLRPTAPISVIATDYVTYACTYSCMRSFAMKAEFAWVLSRHPVLDKRSLEMCDKAFTNKAEFDLNKLESVTQGKDCPYWVHLNPEEKSLNLLTTMNDIVPNEEKPEEYLGRLESTPEEQATSSASLHALSSYLALPVLVIVYLATVNSKFTV
ncbi:Lipocalin/cytosolic fatty-acid binding domain [Trinorchestia longiramus]|nr:Lipocalin/cytosolic fatty-acid binding domain [Trinorchestia longiramus]